MPPVKRSSKLKKTRSISFSGVAGSFSDISCRAMFPRAKTIPCVTFEDAFAALISGRADLAMIPIENAIAGRVADVHHLMSQMKGLHIVAEHFQPVEFCLLGTKNSKINDLTHVHSHIMALPQCRDEIRRLRLKEVVHDDTAGAAEKVARDGDKTQGALASALAAKLYGLKILKSGIQNTQDNVTRFVVFSKENVVPDIGTRSMTSFFFEGQSIPAFLYKILGAFATNKINFTKLESYVEGFKAAKFYCEVEGHPDEPRMQRAFEEVKFFTKGKYRILGTFPMHKYRGKK
jgi:prephenate dehydratase